MTEMTDRELLELAAKAIGGEFHSGHLSTDGGIEWDEWNPLFSDGDALRLAVKLRLSISTPHGHYRATAQSQDRKRGVMANDGDDSLNDTDPYAATRRAIVRAAASIGERIRAAAEIGKTGGGE